MAPAHYVQASSVQGCWQSVKGGYQPRVKVSVTPSEKLEALVVGVQFGHAGQSATPVVSYQEDAQAHLRSDSVLLGKAVVTGLPLKQGAVAVVSARILPYADRTTTKLGSVQAVVLARIALTALCKS